jgi:hypothetical protein
VEVNKNGKQSSFLRHDNIQGCKKLYSKGTVNFTKIISLKLLKLSNRQVLVLGRTFQLILMFEERPEAYPKWNHLKSRLLTKQYYFEKLAQEQTL